MHQSRWSESGVNFPPFVADNETMFLDSPSCLNSHLSVAGKGSDGMVCPYFNQIGDELKEPTPTWKITVE